MSRSKILAAGIVAAGILDYSLVKAVPGRTRSAVMRDELMTEPHIDLKRYMGRWYEIARYPVPFEKNCYDVTAEYSLRRDGKVTVVNSCRKGSPDGPWRSVQGIAWVADTNSNAKLKVRFVWPFSGDYWVIEVGQNYEYAVVGEPRRKALWILSRTPQMDNETYFRIREKLQEQGYDTARIVKTDQTSF